MNILIAVFGMLLTWQKDIRHDKNWFGNVYNDSATLFVRIDEPLIEKTKSYKCEATVENVYNHGKITQTTGKLLVYFSKNSFPSALHYGDKILINKPLQRIENSGNPGAFNYERYAAFQQLFHNVFLKDGDFVLLKEKQINPIRAVIFSTQQYIVHALQKYLPADKNILGIAEALLIGYKEDLDKDLLQAYSNTGVVHIIAISGLHLGLIYVVLVWIFSKLPFIKQSKFLQVVMILGSLWFFSLLTGASASVLRSAVMFTCIVIGKNFFRQSSIYNSLAASAFILLCYNPYFLWDVGFQLSYLAVIGIVWLQKVIYHAFYIKNKYLNKLWEMIAVTVAAQIITFPICIYYFHQFPNTFLITNLLAVPLSTVILFAEIFLIAFSWINVAGIYIGKLIVLLVWLMNFIIQTCDGLPFSRIDNIYATVLSTWILYAFVIAICFWIFFQHQSMFRIVLISLFSFVVLHAFAKYNLYSQKKIVVYNIPKQQAIDFISANKFYFLGDSILQKDGVLRNFQLKPARISLQLTANEKSLNGLVHHNNYWQFLNKTIFIVDSTIFYQPLENKIDVDILIISKNPSLKISNLAAAIKPSIIVFDASNSLWKIANWKKECLALDLRCFSVPGQGAFVFDID